MNTALQHLPLPMQHAYFPASRPNFALASLGALRRRKYGSFYCCDAAFAAIRRRGKASALIFAICCLYALLRRLNIDTVTFDMVLCTT
jgi:hypothetical protein